MATPSASLSLLAQVAPLSPAPALQHYMFEQPLPLAIGLFVAGIGARIILARAGRDGLGRAMGWTGLALGFGAYLGASFIATPRERLGRATRDFFKAAATPDLPALDRVVEPQVSLGFGEIRSARMERAALAWLIERVHGRVEIRGWSLQETQAEVVGPGLGRTQARVRVEPRTWFPSVTWWRIDWRKDPATGEGCAEAITCLLIDGRQPTQEVVNFVTRP